MGCCFLAFTLFLFLLGLSAFFSCLSDFPVRAFFLGFALARSSHGLDFLSHCSLSLYNGFQTAF